ncbi:MAG: HesA/MoeB/ThiF family protein [Rickettsiales bacterium]|jgi:molybdopterin/thiamine biosynthesis adenylyltransferase
MKNSSSAICHLSSDEQRRYARHIVLPEIGEAGQAKLLAAKVLVIGAGGLGSSSIAYLAAAGIGKIGIIEPDRVELSNLQRQIIFETADIGRTKAAAARDRVHEVNPDCSVEIFEEKLTTDNANKFVKNFDIVVDGCDNFETRFAVSAACLQEKKPLISAAISGFFAQLSTFKPYLGSQHPCYRCFVPQMPERERNCAQEGIIGPLAGILGSMQALEVIKELLEIGESLSGKLLIIDALTMNIRKVSLLKDAACVCGSFAVE